MLYLLDANVVIDANRDYYPIDRIPEFWEWLEHHGNQGTIKIVIEVYEEIKLGTDDLATWTKQDRVQQSLLFDEEVDPEHVADVVNRGYAPDLRDDEIGKIGRDAFLIAYAVAGSGDRTVVTTEVSKPGRQRANRHLPDICRSLGVPCCNTFELTRALDFSTSWRSD